MATTTYFSIDTIVHTPHPLLSPPLINNLASATSAALAVLARALVAGTVDDIVDALSNVATVNLTLALAFLIAAIVLLLAATFAGAVFAAVGTVAAVSWGSDCGVDWRGNGHGAEKSENDGLGEEHFESECWF